MSQDHPVLADLTRATAELRHAYMQLANGLVLNQQMFAKGLVGPQILTLERVAAALVAGAPHCVWTEDDDDGHWATACGQDHEFTTDGPVENKAAFCCYCGGALVEKAFAG